MTWMNKLAVLAVLSLAVSPAFGAVDVSFDAQDTIITDVGLTEDVDIVADFTIPIVGWGLDLTITDPTIASVSSVAMGPDWDPVFAPDLDGLAGVAFPTGITGQSVLATLTFAGLAPGTTDIVLSYDEPLVEGFAVDPDAVPPQFDDDVTFHVGTITVLPEPASLALLAIGGLALIRRR